MTITMSSGSYTPWFIWKRNWVDNLTTAAAAACLEFGAFSLFVYMFVQDSYRPWILATVGLPAFWVLHVSVFALNAYLLSHPMLSIRAR
jgi:hypothetical protein